MQKGFREAEKEKKKIKNPLSGIISIEKIKKHFSDIISNQNGMR